MLFYILLSIICLCSVCFFIAMVKAEKERNDYYSKLLQKELDLQAKDDYIKILHEQLKELNNNIIIISDTLPIKNDKVTMKKYKHNCWMKLSNEGINYLKFNDNKVSLKLYRDE